MRHFNQLGGQKLTSSAVGWLGTDYRLRAGDEDAAALRFQGPLRTVATAESGDGRWRFSRRGFLRTRVTVRGGDDGRTVAVFRPGILRNGGTLKLADGRRYRATSNFWTTTYAFSTEDGTPLVRYRFSGILKRSAVIDIQPAAKGLAELSWLVMLGLYLNVLLHNDSGA